MKISKDLLLNLLLLCIGTGVAISGAEIALRILRPQNPGAEFENLEDLRTAMNSKTPHELKADGSVPFVDMIVENANDKIIYELRPNLNVKFTGVPVKTNSFGMRSPEVSVEKPAGTYRIALLGDSFAFGWGVDERKAFGAVLEEELNLRGKGALKFEVLNFGVPGYSSFQEVEVFREKALKFHPDAVLVFLIENDFDFPFFIRSLDKKPSFGGLSLMRITSKAFTPEKMQLELRSRGLDPNSVFYQLDDLCRENGVRFYLAINPRKGWKELQKKLPIIEERPSVHFLNFGDEFDKIVEEKGYTTADLNLPSDPHPTVLRHKLYADLMQDGIFRGASSK